MHDAPDRLDTLLIASGNPHKVNEIAAVLAGLGIACRGLDSLGPPPPEPDETGETFEANARLKALAYAAETGMACLADDSGLEIDALDGRPGVRSARYSEEEHPGEMPRAARDRLNNERVLAELEGVADEGRSARFVCCLCIALPDGTVTHEARGEFEGRIGRPPRVPAGGNGFGYDPVFLVGPDHARTSAELEPGEKNAMSHRGAALRRLASVLAGG